ncbi:MAG: HD-GYP domain-containing protein [Pseudomonadota bacterium]
MLKRIAAKDLRLGMFIAELCGSWMEHPFSKTQFLLDDEKDRESICTSGIREVWIDTSRGSDEASHPTKSASDINQETENLLLRVANAQKVIQVSIQQELTLATKVCDRAKEAVMQIFTEARLGKTIEVSYAQTIVEEISTSVFRQPHALISLARLKNNNMEYTYMHSVAVCALMVALARHMDLDNNMVREAGLAGLLHDIGKIGISHKILNKPGKLTDSEFNTVKNHPEIGWKLLLDNPMISASVVDVVLHHHEKVDGNGYPHRLKGDAISLFAKMGAVCDVYDAITSNRPYKKGWPPAEAIRKMAEWSKNHFDEMVFQSFVKTVGIYPTGSLVRLESDRLGVVLEQNEHSLLTPNVKVFFSAKFKAPILQEIINLSLMVGKDKIVGREAPEDWGFRNLDALWMDE